MSRGCQIIKQVIGGIFIGACVGCQTVEQARDVEVQRQNERAYYQEIIFRLEGRLENLELQQEAFRAEIGRLEQGFRAASEERDALRLAADQKREEHREMVARVEAILEEERTATQTSADRGRGYEHVVESGHTLSAIAVAYDTTVKAIKQANDLSSDQIYAGQTLFIPE